MKFKTKLPRNTKLVCTFVHLIICFHEKTCLYNNLFIYLLPNKCKTLSALCAESKLCFDVLMNCLCKYYANFFFWSSSWTFLMRLMKIYYNRALKSFIPLKLKQISWNFILCKLICFSKLRQTLANFGKYLKKGHCW